MNKEFFRKHFKGNDLLYRAYFNNETREYEIVSRSGDVIMRFPRGNLNLNDYRKLFLFMRDDVLGSIVDFTEDYLPPCFCGHELYKDRIKSYPDFEYSARITRLEASVIRYN